MTTSNPLPVSDVADFSPTRMLGVAEFRGIMGSLASGVSVVTTIDGDSDPRGLTCSALCSVSARPPMLLACVHASSGTLRALLHRGRFAVNLLDAAAHELSALFASQSDAKFDQVDWSPGQVTGMPVLAATIAHAECVVERSVHAGDHVIVIGEMVAGEFEPAGSALGYWRGRYVQLDGFDHA